MDNMMKISDLTGAALDWAVCKAGGGKASTDHQTLCIWLDAHALRGMFNYSTDWSQGGPIIEREGIEILCNVSAEEAKRFIEGTTANWFACHKRRRGEHFHGTTPLIAAMRCYVATKLGDKVDIPRGI